MLLSLENIDAYQKLFGMNDRNMAVLEQELSVVSALRGRSCNFAGTLKMSRLQKPPSHG